MAKRTAKSAKKPTKSSSAPGVSNTLKTVGLSFVLLAFGVVGGYAWRSYAPLPIFEGTALSGNNQEKEKLSADQKKVNKLEEELEEIEELRSKKEQELGDTQIKAILSDS